MSTKFDAFSSMFNSFLCAKFQLFSADFAHLVHNKPKITGRYIWQVCRNLNRFWQRYFWDVLYILYRISSLWSAYDGCGRLKYEIKWKMYIRATGISERILTKYHKLISRLNSVACAKWHYIWANIKHLGHNKLDIGLSYI